MGNKELEELVAVRDTKLKELIYSYIKLGVACGYLKLLKKAKGNE